MDSQDVRYIDRHDYKDKCWWCGSIADSREHKYKKTDIIREYGKGPFRGGSAPVRVYNGQKYFIQGPNSKEAQFEKNLCKHCNEAKSQPFDRAYDRLQNFIKINREFILDSKAIQFRDVYGTDWNKDLHNLMRYYIKHICCRMVSSNIKIDPNITDYLNGAPEVAMYKLDSLFVKI